MTNDEEAESSSRQIVGRKNKAFDPLAAHDSFHDFGDVRYGDAAIKEMVGLDQDADAARALVETTGGANAGLELGQSTRGDLFFQGEAHFLRTSSRATALGIIFRPPVNADEEIALALRHAQRVAPAFRRSIKRRGGSRAKDQLLAERFTELSTPLIADAVDPRAAA
jgi:hypothetical protein